MHEPDEAREDEWRIPFAIDGKDGDGKVQERGEALEDSAKKGHVGGLQLVLRKRRSGNEGGKARRVVRTPIDLPFVLLDGTAPSPKTIYGLGQPSVLLTRPSLATRRDLDEVRAESRCEMPSRQSRREASPRIDLERRSALAGLLVPGLQ